LCAVKLSSIAPFWERKEQSVWERKEQSDFWEFSRAPFENSDFWEWLLRILKSQIAPHVCCIRSAQSRFIILSLLSVSFAKETYNLRADSLRWSIAIWNRTNDSSNAKGFISKSFISKCLPHIYGISKSFRNKTFCIWHWLYF